MEIEVENGSDGLELLAAAERGDSGLVSSILKRRGVNVNSKRGPLALAPLHHAAEKGNAAVLTVLMDHPGIDLNSQDGMGRTALIIASRRGHTEIVRKLLQKGVDVLICARGGFTCLHMAAFCNHNEVVNLLLHGRSSRKFWDDWDRALPDLPVTVRRNLMERKSDEEKFTPLHMAASGGDHRVVASILEAYRTSVLESNDIASKPNNAYGIDKVVWLDFLLQIRDYLELDNSQAIREHMIMYGNTRRGSAIKKKLEDKYEGLVDAFVQLISYSNSKDCIGRTALHYAAWENKAVVAELFSWDSRLGGFTMSELGNVGNLNATDEDGYTPLHLASLKGHENVVRELMKDATTYFYVIMKGLKFTLPGIRNFHERYILRPNGAGGSNGRSQEIINEIERQNVLFDSQRYLLPRPRLHDVVWSENREGVTPLHYAVEKGHEYVVKLLIEHPSIDVFKSTADGKSPWTIAFPSDLKLRKNPTTTIQRLLRSGTTHAPPSAPYVSHIDDEPQHSYRRKLLRKAAELAVEADDVPDFSDELFIGLEIQIFLSFRERLENREVQLQIDAKKSKWMLRAVNDDETWRVVNDYEIWIWEGDYDRKPWNCTLLHVAAYEGFDEELKTLLQIQGFKESINAHYDALQTGETALHFAAMRGQAGALKVLLDEGALRATEADRKHRTPLQIAVEMKSKARNDEKWKHVEQLLMKPPSVQQYLEKLYRDRQVYVDAANAILVGASVIASVTFAGWLQPPLGYTTYYQEFFSNPAPPGTLESFAAVAQHTSVRIFWAFNSLSFFWAIATVVAGAGTVLPATGYFIEEEVRIVRRWLVSTSVLLSLSILCVLGAFTAAGMASLPPIPKYQANMASTASVGFISCIIVLMFFFNRVYWIVRASL